MDVKEDASFFVAWRTLAALGVGPAFDDMILACSGEVVGDDA